MTATPRRRTTLLAAFALFAALTASSAFSADYAPLDPAATHPINTFTKASDDIVLSFAHPGRVDKILVKTGDHVQAGQLLAQQDSSEEQAEYDFAKAQAEDDTRTDAQIKITAQKKKVLERKTAATNSVNATELDEAQLDYEVAVAQTALAKFEHIQDSRKFDQAKAVLDKTKILSPITGVVQQIMVQAGESVDSQSMKVMRIVNVDPLWIDPPVPFAQAAKIKVGDVAHVLFSDNRTADGTVLAIAQVANSESNTRYVRVELKNPDKMAAGERVLVSFDTDGKVADNQKP